MLKDLERLRQEVIAKRSENEIVRGKNKELEHELDRLDDYAHQLKENISDMMDDYRQ
jgi:predicted nuclease with TOPRIM domain